MRPTVLLLHAFPMDSRMWASQRVALEAAGYNVVAPDLPGPTQEASLGAWAERVLGLVDEDFVPVGVSMGGYLSFELWRRARDRIGALVLVDTKATLDTPEALQAREELIRVAEEEGAPAIWERMRERVVAAGASPEAVERARAIALEQPGSTLAATMRAIRDRADSVGTLGTIDVPVLVVVGEEDPVTPPSDAEAIFEALPKARLVRFPRCGHLPPLERPDEFNTVLLDFLAEVA